VLNRAVVYAYSEHTAILRWDPDIGLYSEAPYLAPMHLRPTLLLRFALFPTCLSPGPRWDCVHTTAAIGSACALHLPPLGPTAPAPPAPLPSLLGEPPAGGGGAAGARSRGGAPLNAELRLAWMAALDKQLIFGAVSRHETLGAQFREGGGRTGGGERAGGATKWALDCKMRLPLHRPAFTQLDPPLCGRPICFQRRHAAIATQKLPIRVTL